MPESPRILDFDICRVFHGDTLVQTLNLVTGDDVRLTDARPPLAHGHVIADTSGLQTALDGKAASAHTHPLADLTQSGAALNDVATWNGSAWVPQAGGGGGVPTSRLISVTSPITGGGDLTADRTIGFDSTAALDNAARVAVNKNSGATVGTRRRINFIEGANVTLTIADDAGNEEVDVTIAASGGGGGGGTWTEAEVDFGSTPKYEASFTVTDGTVSGTSKIIVLPCGKAATGRTADDWQWDGVTLAATPGTGNFTLYAVALPGPVVGPRKIQYQVAS